MFKAGERLLVRIPLTFDNSDDILQKHHDDFLTAFIGVKESHDVRNFDRLRIKQRSRFQKLLDALKFISRAHVIETRDGAREYGRHIVRPVDAFATLQLELGKFGRGNDKRVADIACAFVSCQCHLVNKPIILIGKSKNGITSTLDSGFGEFTAGVPIKSAFCVFNNAPKEAADKSDVFIGSKIAIGFLIVSGEVSERKASRIDFSLLESTHNGAANG